MMQEIDRKLFGSLNKEGHMYYVLNDGYFCYSFYAETDAEAKKIFAERGVKNEEE